MTLATTDLQQRIDAASAAGGGRVTVPAGEHLIGGLLLRSHVELHLEQGAVLRAIADYDAYLDHCRTHHPDQPPMDYTAFFRERQRRSRR